MRLDLEGEELTKYPLRREHAFYAKMHGFVDGRQSFQTLESREFCVKKVSSRFGWMHGATEVAVAVVAACESCSRQIPHQFTNI